MYHKKLIFTAKKIKSTSAIRPWTTEEKAAVLKFFKVEIKNGIVPGKVKCEQCINKKN